MKPEDKVTLSFFRELSSFKDNGNISLVQHVDTQSLYVKKIVPATHKDLFLALQKINAPGTPTIHHILDADSDNIIIIEDYINGKTLDAVMREGRDFNEAETMHVALQICRSLLELHNAQPPIIHRDIKPSNIIVSDELDATLIDFDASKLYVQDKGCDTVLMGTVSYAAPEQYGFSQSDARTDIYTLGVLMNKMLTGFFPNEVMYQGKLSGVIKKCIHMDPGKRYPSVDAVVKTLLKHSSRAIRESEKSSASGTSAKWTLPGFRSNKTWKKIIAIAGYIFMIWFASISTFEGPVLQDRLNQMGCFIWEMLVVAIFTNYHNFADTMPISRSKNKIIRYFGCLLWSFTFFIAALSLPDAIYGWFFSK